MHVLLFVLIVAAIIIGSFIWLCKAHPGAGLAVAVLVVAGIVALIGWADHSATENEKRHAQQEASDRAWEVKRRAKEQAEHIRQTSLIKASDLRVDNVGWSLKLSESTYGNNTTDYILVANITNTTDYDLLSLTIRFELEDCALTVGETQWQCIVVGVDKVKISSLVPPHQMRGLRIEGSDFVTNHQAQFHGLPTFQPATQGCGCQKMRWGNLVLEEVIADEHNKPKPDTDDWHDEEWKPGTNWWEKYPAAGEHKSNWEDELPSYESGVVTPPKVKPVDWSDWREGYKPW